MVDINLLKNQAKYIDEKIRCLEIHLEYPASLIYPKQENIIMAEEVITNISTKNKELMVIIFYMIFSFASSHSRSYSLDHVLYIFVCFLYHGAPP